MFRHIGLLLVAFVVVKAIAKGQRLAGGNV